MAEDEDDVFEEPDFDDLEEALKADREEHREQVSLEWVETIREAGEVWRESEDVETVSDEVGLSLERTKEALTVYRLIFEEVPMAVASKSVISGRSFFSLESEVTTLDPEDEGESVEDLLREYIGAVYLEHDIQEEEVGEPPERETPRLGFEGVGLDLDMGGLFPSYVTWYDAGGWTPRRTYCETCCPEAVDPGTEGADEAILIGVFFSHRLAGVRVRDRSQPQPDL